MNSDKLSELHIPAEDRKRPQRPLWIIFIAVILVTGIALYLAWPRASDLVRLQNGKKNGSTNAVAAVPAADSNAVAPPTISATNASTPDDVVLTVSGYIINRERIELSPRFMGTVNWIGVKKGDVVKKGEVVVLLDDTEYKARLHEAEGHLATAKAMVARAKLDYDRIVQLNKTQTESQKAEDDARLQLQADEAAITEAEGSYEVAKTYVDWTVIRSPIDGVVLEKLVQPNELVMPQSFGGAHGPSTALIAVADPKDLQVEIDLSEADLSKVSMGQKCRISPEAYPDKVYQGRVAEIAPEADRQKGTLQVKVQIQEPDHFLTPELSAKVEFLKQ
ncbi:MAG TPA: efflux RND transporter periplasmic adaptor subunit [Verrucomicrobiae bacterium]|jgi:RND family efflux transporter MFP subunit|nr:efflux RND transporter periplasmic adaptor subunit [Verrucomicrobiae bacterium]